MKMMPYSLVKKTALSTLHTKLSQREKEMSEATQFIKAIEDGNLDIRYQEEETTLESENVLASSLVSMRNQMKRFAQDEQQRKWITEGLAKFADILRAKNDDINLLADNIVSHLVKYMEANQGALYVLNDDNEKDLYLEMIACFAYNRKKYLHQRIEIGEGLTGQTVLEKDTIYLTDIPDNYIHITSGLGTATPNALLLVPLKIEEKVFGVVEIASFGSIKQHQIDFVEKLGESIASTISAVKVTERTKKLLQATQQQAEMMRSQEEEMRQNMEELSATQEDMQRILKEVQDKEGYLNEVLNASKDAIFTIDREFKVISFNKAFAAIVKNLGFELKRGEDILIISEEGPVREKQKLNYQKVLAGEHLEVTETHDIGGSFFHFVSIFSPLKNEDGEILGAACYAKDITEIINARQDAEKLAAQAQQVVEEMKAQEEELRQNMEELSATQEEIQRILKEAQEQEAYLSEVLNASKDSIFTLDPDYRIISFNHTFRLTVESIGFEVKKGLDMLSILNEGKEREEQKGYYERAFKGEYFEVVSTFNVAGTESTFVNAYCPLVDKDGKVFALAVFAKDTSELVKAQKEAEAAYKLAHEKEMYMNNMLNATTDAILTVDRDLKVVLANNVMLKTFRAQGVNVDVGFQVTELAQKGKEEEFMAPYYKAFAGETVETTREYFEHSYLITYNPLLDDEGKIMGVSLFTKDVSESKRLQRETEKLLAQSQQQAEELKAQEEEIRQNMEELSTTQEEMQRHLLEVENVKKELQVREYVFGYTTILSESDAQGNILYVNDKLCEVSQYSREELIGQPHNIFRHPDMPKELFQLFWKTIKKGEVFQGILKNRAKDGSHYWVDATILPIKDEDGKIIKFVGARYHLAHEEMAQLLYQQQAARLGLAEVTAR